MQEIIDARCLSCPQPVILAKKRLQKGAFPVEVLVDNNTSCENVTRMARSKGYTVTIESQNEDFKITINKA